MSYRIEKEGFEYLGVQLGQKCIYDGVECTVIGFDERGLDEYFIAVSCTELSDDAIGDLSLIAVILEDCLELNFDWASKSEIQLLPFAPSISDENLPSQISPIHALEILEDEVNRLTHKYGLGEELRVVKECISVLKS